MLLPISGTYYLVLELSGNKPVIQAKIRRTLNEKELAGMEYVVATLPMKQFVN